MKKTEIVLKEFVSKLPYDGLKYLAERFNQRVGSDLSEAVDFCLKNSEVDKVFSLAKDSEEFWGVLDTIAGYVSKECSRRAPDLVK